MQMKRCRRNQVWKLVLQLTSLVQIFILYSEKQTISSSENTEHFRGLGYVDSHKDFLEIEFELNSAPKKADTVSEKSKLRRNKSKPRELHSVEVRLHQDTTALRSRKGDTGSV